jgi:hypothetical protein
MCLKGIKIPSTLYAIPNSFGAPLVTSEKGQH